MFELTLIITPSLDKKDSTILTIVHCIILDNFPQSYLGTNQFDRSLMLYIINNFHQVVYFIVLHSQIGVVHQKYYI